MLTLTLTLTLAQHLTLALITPPTVTSPIRSVQGTSVWRFLCHDLLALEGQPTTEQPLQKRLALLESELLAPRKATGASRRSRPTSNQPCERFLAHSTPVTLNTHPLPNNRMSLGIDLSSEKLRVRKKDCYRLKYIPYLLKQFIPKLTHAANGLVLLPSDVPFQVEVWVARHSRIAPLFLLSSCAPCRRMAKCACLSGAKEAWQAMARRWKRRSLYCGLRSISSREGAPSADVCSKLGAFFFSHP